MAAATSLRDKIAQMLIIGFDGKSVDERSPIIKSIVTDNIGGVILFDYNYQTKRCDKNIESPAQVRELNTGLQHFAQIANIKYNRPLLPLLISIDYEGGKIDRLKTAYGFPETLAAATVGKMPENDANLVARAMALTLKDLGFNLNFAPVVDLNLNKNNPIIGKLERSFAYDSTTVAFYANLYAKNFLEQNIQCAYKHFPGHGSSNSDSHLGCVDITQSWQSAELEPYSSLLSPNCNMIMTAHIINHKLDPAGLPATLSHAMLTCILRQQLNFKGVIITDDMQMQAISQYYGLEQALILAINAGADMFIFGNQLTDTPQDPAMIIDLIENAVNSAKISHDRINEAYRHIISFKRAYKAQKKINS